MLPPVKPKPVSTSPPATDIPEPTPLTADRGGLQRRHYPGLSSGRSGVSSLQTKRNAWVIPVVVLGCVAVLLLLALGAAMSLIGSDSAHPGHSDLAETPDEWDPVLEPYVEFVASSRGLSFVHPVAVDFRDIESSLSDDAASSLSDFDDDTVAYFQAWGRVTTILGLTEADQDPFESQSNVQAEGAAAFYDLSEEVIVLPTGDAGIDLQFSIVHELTHALQHQNGLFEGVSATADQGTMGLALTEGDASRIENLWFDQLSEAEKSAVWEESGQAQQDETILEGYYFVSFVAPYILGEPIVDLLLSQGGQERLDSELGNARFSTELLIDPFSVSPYPRMLNKLDSVSAVPESADYELTGTLGPLMLYQTLAPIIGSEMAVEALRGYDADQFSSWSDSSVTCIELQIAFGTPADAREFVELATPVLGSPTTLGRTDLALGSRHYRLCDSEPLGDPQEQTLELLYPVALNNYLAMVLLSSGYDPKTARCAAAEVAFGVEASFEQGIDFLALADQAKEAASSNRCV